MQTMAMATGRQSIMRRRRHAASVAATSLFTFETKNHKQIRVHACTYLLMLAHTCTEWIVYRKVSWTARALFELRIATASQVRFRMRMWQTTLLVMTFDSVGISPMKIIFGKRLQLTMNNTRHDPKCLMQFADGNLAMFIEYRLMKNTHKLQIQIL